MANRRFNQFFYTFHNKPVQLDCNFIVDSANGNGFGARALKGAGIANIYMHTSATPHVGNPNPASGIIIAKLQDNYNFYYGGTAGFVSPVSGTPIVVTAAGAALTVGIPYVIVSLGTTTAADWVTLGVPVGTPPAVGVAFIAAVTGAGTGTGAVETSTASGVDHIEVIGDPNTTINSKAAVVMGLTSGSYIVMQCLLNTTRTAPVDGTTVGLTFLLSSSSITNKGD